MGCDLPQEPKGKGEKLMEFKEKELNSVASLIRAIEDALENGVDIDYSNLGILVKNKATITNLSLMFKKDLNIDINEKEHWVTSFYTIDFNFKQFFTLKVTYVEAIIKE